jgi:hypothetical protein
MMMVMVIMTVMNKDGPARKQPGIFYVISPQFVGGLSKITNHLSPESFWAPAALRPEIKASTHYIGGWEGSSAGLHAAVRKKRF